ncbi:MAG: dNTP triphosphohydrolase [Planctomycetia bacterium]|nr:dNTP triphosphohydrolase [Planctomycetia bacterium]
MPESWVEREKLLLAPYAMPSAASAGRKYPEPAHPYRSPFQRDRDRIVHCAAFRRLSAKTQVFTGDLGDYHRTRLTHTLEVASLARTLGRALRLNEDLIEALALIHDLGHPPFGHAGEEALDDCLRDEGGFSHNRHALTIVEELEQRYPEFPGLNLSREVLAGQEARADKRAGPVLLEVQVVDAADSVAYDSHDADDALELGLLRLDELMALPLWREAQRRVRERYAVLAGHELRRAVIKELIDWQISDLLDEARRRLKDATARPGAGGPAECVIRPRDAMAAQKQEIEAFLQERVYRHPQVVAIRERAKQRLHERFSALLAAPALLPPFFQQRAKAVGKARAAGEYLACLTDQAALRGA